MRIEPRSPGKTTKIRVDNIYNRNRGKNLTRFSKTFKSQGKSVDSNNESFDFVAEHSYHTHGFSQRKSPSPLPAIIVPDKPPAKRGLPVCTGLVQKKRTRKPNFDKQKSLTKKQGKSNIILLPGTEPKIRLTTPTPPQSKRGENC